MTSRFDRIKRCNLIYAYHLGVSENKCWAEVLGEGKLYNMPYTKCYCIVVLFPVLKDTGVPYCNTYGIAHKICTFALSLID